MSKKLRMFIPMIILTSLILFWSSVVNASFDDVKSLSGTKNSRINSTFNISYSDLEKNEGLYCIQKHKRFRGTRAFVLTGYVEIDGKQANVYSSKDQIWPTVVKSDLNAQVAYILNQRLGYGTNANPTAAQRAIWHLANDWTYTIFGNSKYAWQKNSEEGPNDVSARAIEYANSIGDTTTAENTQNNIENKTDTSKITVAYIEDGYTRVGPFNWEFGTNTLDNIIVKGNNGDINSNDIRFVKYEGLTPVMVNARDIRSGEDFYVDVKQRNDLTKITGMVLSANSDAWQKQVYKAKVWFFHSADQQNLIYAEVGEGPGQPISKEVTYDISLRTELKAKKVDDRDKTKVLAGVGFKFKAKVFRYVDSKWAWVERYLSNDLTWSTNSENAIILYTNENGEISQPIVKDIIENDIITAVEVSNPYYGYPLDVEFNLKIGGETQTLLQNHQKYVKLSGYVWLDTLPDEKVPTTNGLYDSNREGGFNGIKVYLKDNKGNTLKTTETKELGIYNEINGGEYQFEDVDLDEIQKQNYHIEFEYCGITYQSVGAQINVDNGSKAVDQKTRDVLDSKFTSVNGNGTQNLKINDVTVNYNNIDGHKSTINSHTGCNVYANTNEAGLDIYSMFGATTAEIRNINLGLSKKVQVDYALAQDLYNVRVTVNGYSHIYRYGSVRYTNNGNDIDENSSWNVGVKFQNNNGTYRRAIYDSDLFYEANNHKDNELKVYATYKVALKNETNSYLGKINSIVDYCDNRVNLIAVGTSIDDKDKISGNISYSNKQSYNNEYSKYEINVNTTLNKGETKYIYMQFELERQAVLAIVNNKEVLNNTAEILSYTTYKNNNINTPVSVLDHDSVPGNAIPGNNASLEDDSDSARSLQLELQNARDLTGTVFVDSTGKDNNVYSGQERLGNGTFDNGESTIAGVKVKLQEIGKDDSSYDGERIEKEAVTDENGNFIIQGYIPGKYILTYTWGSKEYPVQYYKGTIYDIKRDQNNKNWYKVNADERKTDALDDLKLRYQIDNEIEQITKNTVIDEINAAYDGQESVIKTTTMNSTTPEMEFTIEYDSTFTDGNKDEVKFTLKNLDLGIVERAKQQLEITKRISALKITLANGQILTDATITEDGKLKGQHQYVSYMKPTENSLGMVKVEVDTEILEHARVEITYDMKVKNISELDYNSNKYYHYGDSSNAEQVRASVTQILDYVDSALEVVDNNWERKDSVVIKEVNARHKNNTEYLSKVNTYYTNPEIKELAYGESITTSMKVSKLITSEKDIEFNNQVEITQILKKNTEISGAPITIKYSEDIPFFDYGDSEKFVILPSTGENNNYTLPIVTGIIAVIVLGLGVIVIKKRVIGKK